MIIEPDLLNCAATLKKQAYFALHVEKRLYYSVSLVIPCVVTCGVADAVGDATHQVIYKTRVHY